MSRRGARKTPHNPAAAPCGMRDRSSIQPRESHIKTPFLAPTTRRHSLTVRLLVAGAGTGTAELLGLHAPVVGDKEGAVVGDESLLKLVLAVLVDVLLVVGNL